MSSILIDRMRESDLERVVALEMENNLSSRGVEKYRLALSDSKNILLTAWHKEREVVGLFSGQIVLDELQIDNIAVAENQRRQGLGARLLKCGLSEASAAGARSAVLELRAANTAAAALYACCGFTVAGRRRAYYHFPEDDALIMMCVIETSKVPENVA
jgi:ribosomal-protein-alanine N-acetyltransferase